MCGLWRVSNKSAKEAVLTEQVCHRVWSADTERIMNMW